MREAVAMAVLLVGASFPACGQEAARTGPRVESKSGTQVVLLGTDTPGSDPRRSGPATLIVVNDTPSLVDFGPRVVRRAAEAYQQGARPEEEYLNEIKEGYDGKVVVGHDLEVY